MKKMLARKERNFNVPSRQFTVSGTVHRVPKSDQSPVNNQYYGIIAWAGRHVFVPAKFIKAWKADFQLDAVVKCSIAQSEKHNNRYQVVAIHSVEAPHTK